MKKRHSKGNVFNKSIVRSIFGSFGRYIAILAIIALGVSFFVGLKMTRPSMVYTTDIYYKEHNMFDLRLLSTIGFNSDEIAYVNALDSVGLAEGAVSVDFLADTDSRGEYVLKAHSLSERVNIPKLISGSMPQKESECLVDKNVFPTEMIGEKIYVSSSNSEQTKQSLAYSEYTVTGIIQSPCYINFERGTTSIGSGKLDGFIYIPTDGFSTEYYTEMYVLSKQKEYLYSDEYDRLIESLSTEVEETAEEKLTKRYEDNLLELNNGIEKLTKAVEMLGGTDNEYGRQLDELLTTKSELPVLKCYVLNRDTNIGYVCFENDSRIVEGLAKIFPVFFFLIAALVCSTTMTRMIDEERTQIGTLRALGYSSARIMLKYMIYSGSAAVFGCVIGVFAGAKLFPFAIWQAYNMMYGFAKIKFTFNLMATVLSILCALLCSVGVTFLACYRELLGMPANLIRPKAPTAGKRIWLEYLGFIWKRMKFLYKVSARNIFRFKKRMFMMLLGIAGCMALVITGFGLKDSIADIANYQYGDILKYDISIQLSENGDADSSSVFTTEAMEYVDDYIFIEERLVDISGNGIIKAFNLEVVDDTKINSFVDMHTAKETLEFPKLGEANVNTKLAKLFGLGVGDEFEVKIGDRDYVTLKVAGIFENYVDNYIFISDETYRNYFQMEFKPLTCFVNLKADADNYETGVMLSKLKGVTAVSVVAQVKQRIANMMESLNYVVWLVIACASALAFIVLFNLGNINITERVREISTLKVLGFYPNETAKYVFRENLVLTIMGIVLGIPLGMWLHGFVLEQIKIDMVSFKITILWQSFLISIALVIGFAFLTDFVLRRKISGINMAEALKAME